MKFIALSISYGVTEKQIGESVKQLDINVPPQIFKKVNGQYAGTVKERLNALHNAYKDKKSEAIFIARGGYGAVELLDRIDWKLIGKNEKPFIGLSDTTAFSLALWKKCRQENYTGSLLWNDYFGDIRQIIDTIEKKPQTIKGKTLSKGTAKGILLGGCLSLVCQIVGTPFAPDFKGSVIVLEDDGETRGRLESKLHFLRLAGIFDRCAGVVFGKFTSAEKPEEVLKRFTKDYLKGKPVLYDLPYGHIKGGKILPIGRMVEIKDGYLKI